MEQDKDVRIKIGHGTNGDIFEQLQKVKACNFCKHFKGYGLHWLSGFCSLKNETINGRYNTTAKTCGNFEVREELLEENIKKAK